MGIGARRTRRSLFPTSGPSRASSKLVGTTYKADLITGMDHPVLERFRLKAQKTD